MYISDIAVATIHGDYGSGDVRKEALGNKYEDVQRRVNYYLGNPQKHELAKVRYTLRGFAGSGNDRKRYWGKEYNNVQGKTNAVIKTALEIIHGTKKGKAYGKNATRIKNIDAELGEGYGQLVQNYINVLLGVRKKV
jgi:hypothetical protein